MRYAIHLNNTDAQYALNFGVAGGAIEAFPALIAPATIAAGGNGTVNARIKTVPTNPITPNASNIGYFYYFKSQFIGYTCFLIRIARNFNNGNNVVNCINLHSGQGQGVAPNFNNPFSLPPLLLQQTVNITAANAILHGGVIHVTFAL